MSPAVVVPDTPGYRVTLKCDTCGLHRRSYLLDRDGDAADIALVALARGWERQHDGHAQLVIASPALVAVHQILEGPPLEVPSEESGAR